MKHLHLLLILVSHLLSLTAVSHSAEWQLCTQRNQNTARQVRSTGSYYRTTPGFASIQNYRQQSALIAPIATDFPTGTEPQQHTSTVYKADYNPFAHANLNETIYNIRASISSNYRTAQEARFPYLAQRRRQQEDQAGSARMARQRAQQQATALELIRTYNQRYPSLNFPEEFCHTSFIEFERQHLQDVQLEIICDLANQIAFPTRTAGLADFTNTVLSTVNVGYTANCENVRPVAQNFTEIARCLVALGKGLVRGGCNFTKHISNTAWQALQHPVQTAHSAGREIRRLTGDLAAALIKAIIIIEDVDSASPEVVRAHMTEFVQFGAAVHASARDYLNNTPHEEQCAKLGELVTEQTLAWVTGSAVGKGLKWCKKLATVAEVGGAVKRAKKPAHAAQHCNWLRRFGIAGHEAAQVLGLTISEKYELATLNGFIINVKQAHDASGQTLLNQAESYLKKNRNGKKVKSKLNQKVVPDRAASSELIKVPEVNQSPVAILKDGYYEVNGFKFTEYYYNKTWKNGRPAPSLLARDILNNNPEISADFTPGFFRYELNNWEMIYNPTTKEVHHIQPTYKSNKKK